MNSKRKCKDRSTRPCWEKKPRKWRQGPRRTERSHSICPISHLLLRPEIEAPKGNWAFGMPDQTLIRTETGPSLGSWMPVGWGEVSWHVNNHLLPLVNRGEKSWKFPEGREPVLFFSSHSSIHNFQDATVNYRTCEEAETNLYPRGNSSRSKPQMIDHKRCCWVLPALSLITCSFGSQLPGVGTVEWPWREAHMVRNWGLQPTTSTYSLAVWVGRLGAPNGWQPPWTTSCL